MPAGSDEENRAFLLSEQRVLTTVKSETGKTKSKFPLNYKDQSLGELTGKTGHKTLAAWAIDCVKRVLPYFEEQYPQDNRPRKAIETLRKWIRTGVFSMAVIRKAALDAHAAARETEEDSAARSAARAAGQAVATAHVPAHSIGAANYALQAVYRAANSSDAMAVVAKERDWQYRHLLALNEKSPASEMKPVLIAPCGMNCAICMAYLLRKKDKCPGCNGSDEHKTASCARCKIKNCPFFQDGNSSFCYDCGQFPCARLKHLDKRYRTKYGMSMVENLIFIRDRGIRAFIRNEQLRWTCPQCGGTICVHRGYCSTCGTPRPIK
jgi:hypothetical protein